jgi:hypothetical protein
VFFFSFLEWICHPWLVNGSLRYYVYNIAQRKWNWLASFLGFFKFSFPLERTGCGILQEKWYHYKITVCSL